jgi:hypothetical protein
VKPVDFSNVRIACSDAVPPNTILVSRDVYERLKAQNDQKRTIEGEVVREAKKQLDEPKLTLTEAAAIARERYMNSPAGQEFKDHVKRGE